MPKKILYLMNEDWDLVKQRTHFISEILSDYYDMIILYPYKYRRSILSKNDRKGLKIKRIFFLPFYRKEIFYNLNKLYLKIYFRYIIKKNAPDFVWVTLPEFYDYLPSNINCRIIYDCMDDNTEFSDNKKFNHRMLRLEKELIKKSSKIFVSSHDLAIKLNKRQRCKNKLILIRNAFDGNIFKNEHITYEKDFNTYKIGYVGAVSTWFDFEAIYFTLEKIKNIEYHIIGPVLDIDIKKMSHDRINYYGAINHKDLYSYTKDFDCLIMPFKLNELISSVDPIKLYEYVNYNKPIISVYYDEIKRFSPYVYFYSNKEELLAILDDMKLKGFKRKYSDNERINFLENNNWKSRTYKIIKELKKLDN